LRNGLAAIFRVSMRGEEVDDGGCCRMVAHGVYSNTEPGVLGAQAASRLTRHSPWPIFY
jgi:hypothetical protein